MTYSIVMRRWVFLALLNASVGIPGQHPETMSLLEKPLFAPPLSKEERGRREDALGVARAAFERDRTNVDAILGLARAEMALGRVGDALEVVTRGLEVTPDDPRLMLERARGLIVIRKFDLAIKELRKSGGTLPEAQCAIGVAEYLAADYPHARDSLRPCPELGVFAYLADRRAGGSSVPRPEVSREPTRDPAPAIRLPGAATKPGPPTRVPMTASYMDAIERLIAGNRDAARDLLKAIVEKSSREWMDPVYVAAEADYARLLKAEGKKKKKK
jgi:tetratricopeptide (TPR) repeat protein